MAGLRPSYQGLGLNPHRPVLGSVFRKVGGTFTGFHHLHGKNAFARSPRSHYRAGQLTNAVVYPPGARISSKLVNSNRSVEAGPIEPFHSHSRQPFALQQHVHAAQVEAMRAHYRAQWIAARRSDLDDAIVANNYAQASFLWRAAHYRSRKLTFEREREWREEVAPRLNVLRRMTGLTAWYRRFEWLSRAHKAWIERLSEESKEWVTLENLDEKLTSIFEGSSASPADGFSGSEEEEEAAAVKIRVTPPLSTLPAGAVRREAPGSAMTADDVANQADIAARHAFAPYAQRYRERDASAALPPLPDAWAAASGERVNMFGVVPLAETVDGHVDVAMPPPRPAATVYRPRSEPGHDQFKATRAAAGSGAQFTENMAKRVRERLQFMATTYAKVGSRQVRVERESAWELIRKAKFETRGYIE